MMGLLDLPAPLFAAFDRLMGAALPPIARLAVWALIGAVVSMELYKLLSPQARIAELRTELETAQRKVSGFDGEFAEAWPLIRRMLSLALKRIGVILPGTVIASLPVLALIIWLDTAYGHAFPPAGAPVAVDVAKPFTAKWQDGGAEPHALVFNGDQMVVDQAIAAAVPVVSKRHWWNMLIGNPAGYLDREAPVDDIAMVLPARQLVAFGPAWARGWEPVFFAAIILFAFALKRVRRIE
jgi:hypothetical protein